MVIKQKHLIEFQIYYLLIVEALIDLLHFPDIIRYVLDVNLIFLLFMFIPKIKSIINDNATKKTHFYIFGYMFATIAFSIIRRTPFGQVAWAARNNYFYFIFYFICAYTLGSDDFKRIIKNVVRLQAFNIVCVLYEYLILKHFGDNVGGMFGTASGCNGYLNVYLCIISAYVLIQYLNKKASLSYVAYIVLSSMAIAVVSELKFYFIEFIIIILATLILTSANAKSGLIVIVGIVTLFVGVQILTAVNPWSADLISDFDSLSEYTKTTYNGTVIARATPFSQINDYFFRDNVFYNLFGYGFGACEDSVSFAWANSDFATEFRDLGYRNLSTSMVYIELGYTGVAAFLAIFVILFANIQQLKQKATENKNLYVFSQTVSVIAITNIWYNSTIRRGIAYLTFFALSAFVICAREQAKKELEEKQKEMPPEKKSYFKKKNKKSRSII